MAQCEANGITPGRPNFGKQCGRRAVTGSTFCVMHGGKKDTRTPEKVRKRIDRQGVQCSRTKKDGEQCKNYAVPGTTVCRKHGGNAPQTRAKARERLLAIVEPALVELNRIVKKSDTSDADRLRAITIVLDRTGYGQKSELEVTVKPWEQTLQGILKSAPAELQQELPVLDAVVVEDDVDALEEQFYRPAAAPRVVGSNKPPVHPDLRRRPSDD